MAINGCGYRPNASDNWHEYFKYVTDCKFMMTYKNEIESVPNIKFMYSPWYISSKVIKTYNIQTKVKKLSKGGNKVQQGAAWSADGSSG